MPYGMASCYIFFSFVAVGVVIAMYLMFVKHGRGPKAGE
jgi:hypothetical protein